MSTGAEKFGMQPLTAPSMPFTDAAPGASNGAVTTGNARNFLDPDGPEIWLFGIGALLLGLVAVSTSARVGPLRFSLDAGK